MSRILFTTFFMIASTAFAVNMPITFRQEVEKLREIVEENGCDANVCFAMDGSGSVTPEQFTLSKFFVLDVVNAISADNGVNYSAGQYGRLGYPISPVTDDPAEFAEAIDDAKPVSDDTTNVAGGLLYCANQLTFARRKALKMVVIGDGNNSFGNFPITVANLYRQQFRGNLEICAVGVGFDDDQKLVDLVGGTPERVFTVDEYIELTTVLEELVKGVCGIELN